MGGTEAPLIGLENLRRSLFSLVFSDVHPTTLHDLLSVTLSFIVISNVICVLRYESFQFMFAVNGDIKGGDNIMMVQVLAPRPRHARIHVPSYIQIALC